ncbi:MAG: hypothetical protein H0W06_08605 [Chloroflexia bacterium]|nr:hypothetical protein [Chloroflexia bacterium]
MVAMFTRNTLVLLALIAMIALGALASGLAAVTGAAATPVATPIVAMSADEAIAAITADDGTLRFDVSEDATRFVFAPQPVHDDGMPAYGNGFVTQGFIYPEGTLDGTNGVLADGSPEFPDQVLGEWTCRGWFVGDGAHTTTGAWVITTQQYNFGGEVGDATLITEGYEIADLNVPSERAISGGTGPYVAATGAGEQTLLGFNASEGVVLRFELTVQGG